MSPLLKVVTGKILSLCRKFVCAVLHRGNANKTVKPFHSARLTLEQTAYCVHSHACDQNFKKKYRSRTHGRGEEAQFSSGWILIRSELSSLNFNSSVGAEQSFAIRYLDVEIKFLCGNLDVYLNYEANSRGVLLACFCSQPATERERCFFQSRFFRSRS